MTAEQLAQRMGGPTATIAVAPETYPEADPANRVKLTGAGWARMIRRYKLSST